MYYVVNFDLFEATEKPQTIPTLYNLQSAIIQNLHSKFKYGSREKPLDVTEKSGPGRESHALKSANLS